MTKSAQFGSNGFKRHGVAGSAAAVGLAVAAFALPVIGQWMGGWAPSGTGDSGVMLIAPEVAAALEPIEIPSSDAAAVPDRVVVAPVAAPVAADPAAASELHAGLWAGESEGY